MTARLGLSPPNAALLRERGNHRDQELDELAFLITLRLGGRLSSDQSRLRRARSRRDKIGAYPADQDRIRGSAKVVAFCARLSVAVFAAAGAIILSFPWWATALLGIACAIMVAGVLRSVLAVAVGLALIVILYPKGWEWTIFTEYMAMIVLLARQANAALNGGAFGPGLGFIPLRAVILLGLRGAWSSFSIGVDKAQNDDVARAEPFLAAAEARSGAYRVVIRYARALVLARSGDSTGALRLVSADEEQPGLPASVRGWCSLVVSDILALASQDEAALVQLDSAITLLTTRRSRGVRIAAQLRRIDAVIKQGDYDGALETLVEVRWQAVRHRHSELVGTTEGYLVQMMLGVGNRSGALWVLDQISPRDARRVRVSESGARSATWNVLHSQVALQQGDGDEAIRQAETAVQRADQLADIGVRAAAYLALADVRNEFIGAAAGLPYLLTALEALQQVRYGLPASNWRRNWVRLNTRAYELGLTIASDVDDPYLMAEVIETIRAQAVPIGLDRSQRSLETFLNALMDPLLDRAASVPSTVADEATRTAESALGVIGVDPVHPPAAIYVQGASWISKSLDNIADLDALIVTTIGPAGWYWSACIGGGRYWWVVRHPDGSWLWGTTDLSEGSLGRAALDDLLYALPIPRKDETDDEFTTRYLSSPLWPPRHETDTWTTILERAAESFLPPPLRDALAGASPDEPIPLLVSLNGALAALPVNALPVNALPVVEARLVIDTALVSHIPAPALLGRHHDDDAPPSGAVTGITLAVVDPDPSHERKLSNAKAPASAVTVLTRPTTKEQIMDALSKADPRGVFCAFGHYGYPSDGVPASGGLDVAGGVLSLRDLVTPVDGQQRVRVPDRVLLSLCESLAAGAQEAVRADSTFNLSSGTWEWLGLTAGFLVAGAQHIVAAAWPLPDMRATKLLDQALAEALTQPAPAIAVRDAILNIVPPGRHRAKTPVMVWAAYSYIGPIPTDRRLIS